jgi:large subunit ribosomal protein L18
MGRKLIRKANPRHRRHLRIRKKIAGTSERPRLAVFRSLRHIQAQLIDDASGRCILGVSSLSAEVRDRVAGLQGKVQKGQEVGRVLAAKAREAGITQVVFDRGGYLYHGRVKALAEGAREAGLKF